MNIDQAMGHLLHVAVAGSDDTTEAVKVVIADHARLEAENEALRCDLDADGCPTKGDWVYRPDIAASAKRIIRMIDPHDTSERPSFIDAEGAVEMFLEKVPKAFEIIDENADLKELLTELSGFVAGQAAALAAAKQAGEGEGGSGDETD